MKTSARLMIVTLTTLLNLAFAVLAGATGEAPKQMGDKAPGDRLTRATRVPLDFDDASITEVARAIGERSGKRIQAAGHATTKGMIIVRHGIEPDPTWGNRRVTLKAAEPVRFWEAVDRLCEAGKIGYRLAEFGETGSAASGLVFEESDKRAGGLVQYAGPFRIALVGLHEHRDALFVHGPWVRAYANMPASIDSAALKSAPSDGGPLYAALMVMAEPGLICRRDGPLRELEATDSQGRSLLDPSAEERMARSALHADFVWGTPAPLRIPLKRPSGSVQTIAQLTGAIPVEIAVVRDKPALTIPLQGARGKQFQGAGAMFTVETYSTGPDGRTTLALTARLLEDLKPPGLRESRLWSLRTYQYRVVDAHGKNVRFHESSGSGDGQGATSLKFIYEPGVVPMPVASGPPVNVLVYDLDRVSWLVPFSFQDVPLP